MTLIKEIFHLYIPNNLTIAELAINGVPVKIFDDFIKFVDQQTICKLLNVSPKTISNYRQKRKFLIR